MTAPVSTLTVAEVLTDVENAITSVEGVVSFVQKFESILPTEDQTILNTLSTALPIVAGFLKKL